MAFILGHLKQQFSIETIDISRNIIPILGVIIINLSVCRSSYRNHTKTKFDNLNTCRYIFTSKCIKYLGFYKTEFLQWGGVGWSYSGEGWGGQSYCNNKVHVYIHIYNAQYLKKCTSYRKAFTNVVLLLSQYIEGCRSNFMA